MLLQRVLTRPHSPALGVRRLRAYYGFSLFIPVRVPPYKILSIVLCKQSVIRALQDVCSVVLYGAPDGVKPKTIGSLSRVSHASPALL